MTITGSFTQNVPNDLRGGRKAAARDLVPRPERIYQSMLSPAASDYESDARRMMFLILSWKGHTPRR